MLRNLNNKIPNAVNFQYKEFVKSTIAIRFNILNEPSEKEWLKIETLAVNVLQPVREKFGGIRITSGYRCEELNTKVGSGSYSNHIKGEAVDIEPLNINITNLDVLIWIYENLEFRTLIYEYGHDGWIHVDFRDGGNNKTLKLKDKDHNYTEVTVNYLKQIYA